MSLLTRCSALLLVAVLALAGELTQGATRADAGMLVCPQQAAHSVFSDVRGNAHESAIDCVVSLGVARGISADQYAPGRLVTREQMASFLVRMLDLTLEPLPDPTGMRFADVQGPHAAAVTRLSAVGIARGTTPTTFSPRRAVTRAQMATFLVRAQEYATGQELPVAVLPFADVRAGEHAVNIAKAVVAGITVGTSPLSFEPDRGVRRDQMASFMSRSLDLLVQRGKTAPGPREPGPQPDPEPQDVHFPPGSIADDCSRDETDALNAWLDSLPDGATARLSDGACYRAEHTVEITDAPGITLDGNGATLQRTQVTNERLRYPKSNSHLRVVNSPNVTVRDLTIVGTNDGRDLGGTVFDRDGATRKVDCYTQLGFTCYSVAFEFEHGVDLRGAIDVTVEDVTVDAVWGDGAYVAGSDQFAPVGSHGAVLENMTVSRNGRQGIAVVRSSDVLIDGADIQSSRRSGIDLEPDRGSEVISNIEIRNSTVHSWLLAFASGGKGNVSNVYIHDNTVTRSGTPFVYVRATDETRRANWRVHDNQVTRGLGSPQAAMLFFHVDNVSVVGNTVKIAETQSQRFIDFRDVGGTLEVKNNDVRSATTGGLYRVDGEGLATGVEACGNTTVDGTQQPAAC